MLCVFTIVNIAVLVLRKQPVDHDHFTAPTWLPYLGAVACAFLAGPWARSAEQQEQYQIAGGLLAVGVVLWALTWFDQPWRPGEEDRLPRHRAPGEVVQPPSVTDQSD